MSGDVKTRIEDIVPAEALDDTGGRGPLAAAAEAVVLPGSVEQVVEVVRWAGASGRRIVPIGTGQRVCGEHAAGPYVLLSTHRLSSIDIYEPADLTITLGAGLTISGLHEATRPNQQWLPFDPPTFSSRTVGGLVAAGLTGPLWAGYGDIKNHVLGATVVCGDGRCLRLGGRVVKNVAGFDLLRPVVGSRGSLAVITSVTLRLFPVPAVDRVLVLEGERLEDLVPAARRVATATVLPVSIVITNHNGAPKLLVRLHGASPTVDADQKTLEAAVGSQFRSFEGEKALEIARAARDAGVGLLHSVTMFGKGTELAELIRQAQEIPDATISADAYRCSVTVGTTAPIDECLNTGRPLDPEIVVLNAGTRGVFDPGGVMWSPQP